MSIVSQLQPYKRMVDTRAQEFLTQQFQSAEVDDWLGDAITRLTPFVTGGKTIRGSLLLFTKTLLTDNLAPDDIDLAVALELIHSGFLIHDDIMDNDSMRRGQPAIHEQYAALARSQQLSQPDHLGQAFGICVGDVAFFLAYQLISSPAIVKQMSREIMLVARGQMADMYICNRDVKQVSREDIINVYTYKTARYTFSLPLSLAAELAGLPQSVQHQLTNIGITLGLLYQIRDDELNLFGDQQTTGKPAGSDLREQKKTLHYLSAVKKFPEGPISAQSIVQIQPDITKLTHQLQQQTNQAIDTLRMDNQVKQFLHTLLLFCTQRQT